VGTNVCGNALTGTLPIVRSIRRESAGASGLSSAISFRSWVRAPEAVIFLAHSTCRCAYIEPVGMNQQHIEIQPLSLRASFQTDTRSVLGLACCKQFFCQSVSKKRKRGQSTARTTAPEAKPASRDNNQQASKCNLLARVSPVTCNNFLLGRHFAASALRHGRASPHFNEP
jgi:hypothetical protein